MGEEGDRLMSVDAPKPRQHTVLEDAFAILIATTIMSIGIALYTKATIITGSTAGIALLISYATGLNFGILFFCINVPFYVLAFIRMGLPFTARTVISVLLLSVLSTLVPNWMSLDSVNPIFAALAGGGMIGLGILFLFRHRSSAGGVSILGLYLQERFGLRAGYFQLAVDTAIMVAALFVIPFDRVLLSLAGAVVLNVIIAINHKPGRYIGFS